MTTHEILACIITEDHVEKHKDFGKTLSKLMIQNLFELMGDDYDIQRVEEEKPHIKGLLSTLAHLLSHEKIKSRHVKQILAEAWQTDQYVWDIGYYIIDSKMFEEVSLDGIIDEVIAEETKAWEDFKAGNQKVIGRLIGGVMKKTNGKADPEEAGKLFKEKI